MNKKIAVVFPGQGAQAVGMLANLAADFSIVPATFAEASTVLSYDLWQLVQNGPEELLNQTEYTQPALLAASVAIWRVVQQESNLQPVMMAGHSLGEYTALVCADALDFTDAIKIVAARGHYMQEVVPEGVGGMAAIIGLPESMVEELCRQAAQDQVVAPANFNALGQVVVAGHTEAVDRVVVFAKEAGAKLAKRVAVSVPSHCLLMEPAAAKLAAVLAEITLRVPAYPIINNVDVTINAEPALISQALVRQLYHPVRWVEIIQTMVAQGIEQIIECGPNKVLVGLIKRIDAKLPALAINDSATLQEVLALG